MAARKKTWHEKLHDAKGLPRIVTIPEDRRADVGGATMVVPAPVDVDAVMRTVPRGDVITTAGIRGILAARYGTDVCCPLTTGIFTWIAAHAAEEEREAGQLLTTPWWRTLKSGGLLNPKFPGGVEHQKQLLEEEGLHVVAKGKHWCVLEAAPKGGKP